MKILRLRLENIGPYVDSDNVIDFVIDEIHPVTLIGGKNGSGKTTILQSLKIGLFGSYSFGLSSDSKSFLDKVKPLFNYQKVESGFGRFRIEITLQMEELFDTNTYIISRSWILNNHKLTYDEEIKCNDEKLKRDEEFAFMSKLKDILPPNVIDAILFDGEEVAKIVSDGRISDYVSTIFNSCFKINLFDRLEDDLDGYILIESKNQPCLKEENELISLNNLIKYHKKEYKNIAKEIDRLKELLTTLDHQYVDLQKQYDTFGGITNAEREIIEKTLKSIEKDKDRVNKKIKEYLEQEFAFAMNRDVLNDILGSIPLQRPEVFKKYLIEINKNYPEMNFDKEISFFGAHEDQRVKYDIEIEDMLSNILSKLHKPYKLLLDYESTAAAYDNILINKQKLNLNEKSNDLQRMYIELSNKKEEMEDLNYRIMEKTHLLNDLEKKLVEENEKYYVCEEVLKKKKGILSNINIVSDLKHIIHNYKNYQYSNKLSEISTLASEKFKEVIRKNDYITKIEILDEFNIIIYDDQSMKMDINYLSAGEKQLLLASIVWAIFKSAGRDNLFIFDTPLARLDSENRELYIKNIISTISSQIIVLSTDEEFMKDNLKYIEKAVSQQYLLDNNSKLGKTTILRNYFTEDEV